MTELQQEGLRILLSSSAKYVIGIDEVGYGAWAGPLTVGGVVFEKGWGSDKLRDSKKMTAKLREKLLVTLIHPNAVYSITKSMTAREVDELGVKDALRKLHRDVCSVCYFSYMDSVVVIDGERDYSSYINKPDVIYLPKADDIVPAVSAASILAKHQRDRKMVGLATKYPGYAFEKNKGYGTPEHQKGLKELGPCALHRKSYRPIREILAQQGGA